MFVVDTLCRYNDFMTGNELKERRNNLKLSQQKLATRLDLSLSTIARWEQMKEEKIPDSKMLELALKALEIENK